MKQKILEILNTYGMEMVLKSSVGAIKFHGFFQPVRSKSWQYLEGNYSPLGEVPRGQYVYMGPGSLHLKMGDTLTVENRDYMVRRVEPVYYGKEIAYYWGMCVEKGGADTWGQS